VNTLFDALLDNPDFARLDVSHLKAAVGRRHGGATSRGRRVEAG
jgi:hypothetical protein